MSQLDIRAGRINALLDGLGTLLYYACWVIGPLFLLIWLLIAIDSARSGAWTQLLALVSFIGFPLVGIVLAPLVPYGNIFSAFMMVLGVPVAYWILVYH